MQEVAARRAATLARARIFTRSGRVTSPDNNWADWLSRGYIDEVKQAAAALGLRCEELELRPDVRDLTWLLDHA